MGWIEFATVDDIDTAEEIREDVWEDTRVVDVFYDDDGYFVERWTDGDFGWDDVGEYTEDNVGDVLSDFDKDIDNGDFRTVYCYETERFVMERRVDDS